MPRATKGYDKSVSNSVGGYLEQKAIEINEKNKNYINNKAARIVGINKLAIESLKDALSDVFKERWTTPVRYTNKRSHKKHRRIVGSLISDTHFHSLLDPNEVPLAYGAVEESRRLGYVASQVADYKLHYRDDTILMSHLLGDIIQGQLHDARDGAEFAKQQAAAIFYLVQLIMFWSSQYRRVEVYCTPGNHGRNKQRHEERAVHQKWDSHETTIYMAVQVAIQTAGVKNVTFHIPKTPYYTVDIFDKKGFFTHGDTVLKPGYPGRSINVSALYQQICKWNASRNVGAPFHLFACGHVHFGSITNMPNGAVMITNGCLVPPDPFSVSIGASDVACGQYMFESVEGHVVGDQRFIDVDGAESESKYNTIIKPYYF